MHAKPTCGGIYLQHELNQVCEDFGLAKMPLMAQFDPEHLNQFAAHANSLEQQMRRIIADGGGIIREYHSQEEFLP